MSDAWEIANEVNDGDHITVWYDSRRRKSQRTASNTTTSSDWVARGSIPRHSLERVTGA